MATVLSDRRPGGSGCGGGAAGRVSVRQTPDDHWARDETSGGGRASFRCSLSVGCSQPASRRCLSIASKAINDATERRHEFSASVQSLSVPVTSALMLADTATAPQFFLRSTLTRSSNKHCRLLPPIASTYSTYAFEHHYTAIWHSRPIHETSILTQR